MIAAAAGALFSAVSFAQSDGTSALVPQALELDRAARAAEEAAGAPAELYVGGRLNGVVLSYVRAQIDDAPPVQYEYSEAEGLAISKGALHLLLAQPLAEGEHRLQIQYTSHSALNTPGDMPNHGRLDQKIQISADKRWIDAELFNEGFVEKTPEMKVRVLGQGGAAAGAPGAAAPSPDQVAITQNFGIGSDMDPRVRAARLFAAEDRPFSAAAELMYAQGGGDSSAMSPAAAAQLSSALSDLGQAQAAAADASGADDTARYQADVQSIANGHDSGQAAPDLERIGTIKPTDSLGWALRDEANLSLGYAQLHAGQSSAAITSFGRVRAQGPFAPRALLGLGWAFLTSEGAAMPKSDAADSGTLTTDPRPSYILDVEQRQKRASGGLHNSAPNSAQAQALRRAMVPWTELIGRNPMDPAVQEGLVAIAYALDHSGAYEDAQTFYERSVKLQETTLTRLQNATAQIGDGRMLAAVNLGAGGRDAGWHWQLPAVVDDSHWWLTLNDSPVVPDNFYFDELLIEPNFIAALSRYHHVQDLILNNDTHVQALARLGADAGLQQRLQGLKAQLLAAQAAAGEQLKSVALTDIQHEQQQARNYLAEARFALARSNDWAPTELAKNEPVKKK